jgi:predicted enzyme related to lactoylglutathione lyase
MARRSVPMTQAISVIIYPVKDLAPAKRVYQEYLGTEPYADAPYYVGFRIGDQEVGLNPHGHAEGMNGPVAFRAVDDIRASLKSLLDAGAQTQQDVKDVGGGKLTATVRDADGNILGLMQEP